MEGGGMRNVRAVKGGGINSKYITYLHEKGLM